MRHYAGVRDPDHLEEDFASVVHVLHCGTPSTKALAQARETPDECRASMIWAQWLKLVFGIDIETCPACGGALGVIFPIEYPLVIKKIHIHRDK